ncbi:MAG: hypothetical protein DME02_07080 [Candidatus Rokuibacteriota bacterium]|nr:MAG: hypothetical protein DME02_07080 [Candidatus Rokubacteria bacterium]
MGRPARGVPPRRARGGRRPTAEQPDLRESVVRVAIHQPQYLPWLGYLAKWAAADLFVFLDSVQYEKNGWQNRNRIKTADGARWLTVPVHARLGTPITDVAIDGEPARPGGGRERRASRPCDRRDDADAHGVIAGRGRRRPDGSAGGPLSGRRRRHLSGRRPRQ